MLMHKCACVPVCVTECMNYLPVISHKKHIIQTAQDKALLNPITGYNRSPQLHRGEGGSEGGRERGREGGSEGGREGEGNKSVKRVKRERNDSSSLSGSFLLSLFCSPTCLSVFIPLNFILFLLLSIFR